MRRTAPLVLLLGLSGCVGFGEFLDHTFTLPGANPNIPMADSENVRRVLGQEPDIRPLEPEPGNVWPGPPPPEPTLADIQNRPPQQEENRGFPPTQVPGAQPNLPAGRQPRPRGSSTPPGNVQPGLPELPNPGPLPPTSRAPTPPPQPPGGAVALPNGPATETGGTNSYRQLNTPRGPGAIVVPNGNGTSTVINPDGSVQTIPTPR
ncbi:MAG: hypothetical protein JOZ05_01480 [Acetobacteraceae bacterium]|nr:hypothetical protein [Acetobacteraceae bacterium]